MKHLLNFVLVVVVLLGMTGCDSDVTTSNKPSGNSNTTSKEEESKKVYNLNEDVYLKNSSGEEYRLKITSVSETNDRNEFSDVIANRVVLISYEYENISMEDDLNISSFNFKVYDKDNNSLETYPVSVTYSDSVGKGRKTSGSVAYALNNDSNYLELEYYDNIFYSKSDCIFKLEW